MGQYKIKCATGGFAYFLWTVDVFDQMLRLEVMNIK